MFAEIDYSNSMADCLQVLESLTFFSQGESVKIENNTKEFFKLKNNLTTLFSNARIMPAFGVSLHAETVNAIKSENWLQLNFSKELTKNGLPFNALLFKLEKTSGANLIRLYNNKYDGRCIYLDFEKEIDLFKEIKKAQ